jgi:hypothetical protein
MQRDIQSGDAVFILYLKMIYIKPSEISGKIMTLIEESNSQVILISPYVKISQWKKLLNKIEYANSRNVEVLFYVREANRTSETYKDLRSLRFDFTPIRNLHSKLYMNGKYGIVTSMNLLLSSETNSLEIGYQTETDSEYQELVDFYKRYISDELDEVEIEWV